MKFSPPQTLEQIARLIQARYIGPADFPVLGMNEIHVVTPGDIVFVDHPKYYDKALQSAATIILINKEVDRPEGKALLISDDPFRDFNTLTRHFRPWQGLRATVAETATIGEGNQIQPGAIIGNYVRIGKNCRIDANVVLRDHTVLGDNVIIQANSILGSDAFYYKNRPDDFDQLLSGGDVVIGDKVHIGAGCTIDRGVTGSTTIKAGTKIDNQVHIGHDTVIGERCLIASQVGIAGCVVIGDRVTLWGQVGVTSGISIGENTVVSAQSGISKSLKANSHYFGTPADTFRKKYKEIVSIRQIPELEKRIQDLEEK